MKPLSQWEQMAIEAALFRTLKRWQADTSLPSPAPGIANLIALLAKLERGQLYLGRYANVQ